TRSAIRKWFAFVTLYLAALGMAGDLVATVYALLNGDLTLQFTAKAALVLLTAGLVFLYYRSDRRPGDEVWPLRPDRPWRAGGAAGRGRAGGGRRAGGGAAAKARRGKDRGAVRSGALHGAAARGGVRRPAAGDGRRHPLRGW